MAAVFAGVVVPFNDLLAVVLRGVVVVLLLVLWCVDFWGVVEGVFEGVCFCGVVLGVEAGDISGVVGSGEWGGSCESELACCALQRHCNYKEHIDQLLTAGASTAMITSLREKIASAKLL